MRIKILAQEGEKSIEGLWVSNILSTNGEFIREGDMLLVREYENDSHKLYEEKQGRPYYKKNGKPQNDTFEVCQSFTKDDVRGNFMREYKAKVIVYEGTSLCYEVIKSGKSADGVSKETVGTVGGLIDSMNTSSVSPIFDFTIISREDKV